MRQDCSLTEHVEVGGGYEIYLRHPSRGDDLWERILDAGKPLRDLRHSLIGHPTDRGRHLRLGLRLRPRDEPLRGHGPRAAGRAAGADYVGKEALERIRAEGVTRKLVGIELDGDPVDQLTQHWPARHGGERVGHVTDACWSPRLERNIGYVWCRSSWRRPGTRLEVDADDGERPGTTAAIPFVDPQKQVPAP